MSELSVWTPSTPTRRRKCFQCTSCLISQETPDVGLMTVSLEMSVLSCVYKVQIITMTSKTFRRKIILMAITQPLSENGRSGHPMVSVPVFEISLGGLGITQRVWLWRAEHFASLSFFIASCRWMGRKSEKQTQAPQIHVKPVTLFQCQVWPKFSLAALTEGLCVLTVDADLFWKSCMCCSD